MYNFLVLLSMHRGFSKCALAIAFNEIEDREFKLVRFNFEIRDMLITYI